MTAGSDMPPRSNSRGRRWAQPLWACVVFLAASTVACGPKTSTSGTGIEFRPVIEPGAPWNAVTKVIFDGEELALEAGQSFAVDEAEVVSVSASSFGTRYQFAGPDRERFRIFSGLMVGRRVAVLVGGKVIAAPVFVEILPPAGVLHGPGGGWTRAQADSIVDSMR